MKYLLMGLIRLYQVLLSPMVNWRGPVCRYEPSCSHYGYEAVKTHGAVKGGGMTVWRVLRCNPWSSGGYDPVKPLCPIENQEPRWRGTSRPMRRVPLVARRLPTGRSWSVCQTSRTTVWTGPT